MRPKDSVISTVMGIDDVANIRVVPNQTRDDKRPGLSFLLAALTIFAHLVKFANTQALSFVKNQFYDLKSKDALYIDLQEEYFKNQSFVQFSGLQNMTNPHVIPIDPPIRNTNKYPFSLMFWPLPEGSPELKIDRKQPGGCLYKLGISALNQTDIADHTVELVNSMTWFERIRRNFSQNVSGVIKKTYTNYYVALALDKTSTNNPIGKSFNGVFDEEWDDGYVCDSVVYVRFDRVIIFCWKTTNETNAVSNKTTYKLHIKGRVWSPRVGEVNQTNSFSILMRPEQYTAFLAVGPRDMSLRTIICKSSESNVTDVAFYMQSQSFFFIIRLVNEVFRGYVYPPQYKLEDEEQYLPELSYSNKSLLSIYRMEYVDAYKFIITENINGFNEFNSSTYGNVHFIDGALTLGFQFIGKGIIVGYSRGRDLEGNQILAEVMLIVNSTKGIGGTSDNLINIQKRKYYNGYFYGDQTFNLRIGGSPRFFRGYSSKEFYVFTETSAAINFPACGPKTRYYNTKIRLGLKDKTDVNRIVMEFNQTMATPLKFMITHYNNLMYARFPHKLEIMNILDIGVDVVATLADEVNFLRNTSKTKASIRMVTSSANKSEEFAKEAADHRQGYVLQFRSSSNKQPTQIFEFSTNDLSQPSIEAPVGSLSANVDNYRFVFQVPLDEICSGNYLAFRSKRTSAYKIEMNPFEGSALTFTLNSTHKIKNIFAMDYQGVRYLLASFDNDKGSTIYKHDPKLQTVQEFMTLYDNRLVESIQEFYGPKYLLHVTGLLYELDLEKKMLTPVFKSNDLCGTTYTMISHSEFGAMTVCAGRNQLSLFITDPIRRKVDLSNPIGNIYINPTVYHSLKAEKIAAIFSSQHFANRFATLSELVNVMPGSEGDTVCKVKVRIFEITSSKQLIDVIAEHEKWITFSYVVQDINASLINNRLMIFIKGSANGTVFETIQVFLVTKAFTIIFDKEVKIPSIFKTNVREMRPLSTYIPMRSTLMSTIYGARLLMVFSILSSTEDIMMNFDFYDPADNKAPRIVRNVIAVFDPAQSSLDCIKLIPLPAGMTLQSMGVFFLHDPAEPDAVGAVVSGDYNGKSVVFYLIDHSMSVSMYSFTNLDNFFNKERPTNMNFSFFVENPLMNTMKEFVAQITISPNISNTEPVAVRNQTSFELDLVKQKGQKENYPLFITAPNGTLTDLIKGYPQELRFRYDSWIEHSSGKIKANFVYNVFEYPPNKVAEVIDMIAYKFSFSSSENAFIAPFQARIFPTDQKDYLDLLFTSAGITMPLQILRSKALEVQPNIYLSAKHRCSKFFFMTGPNSSSEELLACLELVANQETGKLLSINIFIFDERDGKSKTYSAFDKLNPAINVEIDFDRFPFNDLILTSTLNHVLLLHRNPFTQTAYKYVIFKVQVVAGAYTLVKLHSEESWMADFTFSNNFYEEPTTKAIRERFCVASFNKDDSFKLIYFCCVYDPNNPTVFKPMNFNAPLFKYFNYEDRETHNPKIILHNPTRNPSSAKGFVLRDPNLYVMLNFRGYLSALVAIDPFKDGEEQAQSGLMKVAIFCNPFEGFRFDREFQTMSESIYVKVGMTKTKTYFYFYNLPSVYNPDNMYSFPGFYTVKELVQATKTNKLECLKSKLTKEFEYPAEDVSFLRFNNKRIADLEEYTKGDADLLAVHIASTVGDHPLVFNRNALQLLVRSTGNRLFRVEYAPVFSVSSPATLLLSDKVQVDVIGMFNSNVTLEVALKSGKFTNIWFMVQYVAPLVILVAVLGILRYLIGMVFSKIEGSKDDGQRTAQFKSRKVFADILTSTSKDAVAVSSMASETEREQALLADAKASRYKREALGMALLSEDQEFANEAIDADFIKQLYQDSLLSIEISKERGEAIEKALQSEDRLNFTKLAALKEAETFVSPEAKQDLEEYEEYLRQRLSRDKQRMVESMSPKLQSRRLTKEPESNERRGVLAQDSDNSGNSKSSENSEDSSDEQQPNKSNPAGQSRASKLLTLSETDVKLQAQGGIKLAKIEADNPLLKRLAAKRKAQGEDDDN